jgi:prevent-host-death family protein
MSTEVSAFEAKKRLSELLRETEQGKSYIILRRGKPVARLVPPGDQTSGQDLATILASFREVRKRVHGRVKVRELIEAGRRA